MPARRLLVDLAPLRQSAQFRRLWSGYLASVMGTQVTAVAVPYQVFRITHSSLDVGLIGLAQIGPVLAGALVGGSVADAVDRRRLLLVCQILLGTSSAGLLWNASLGHPKLWPLYVLSAIGGGFSSVDGSTRAAVIANLVERRQLASANALWQLLFQVGSVAGPAIAGVLVGQVGVASTYAVDAGTSLIALASVATLQPLPPLGGGTRFGWQSMKEGLRFLRGRQLLQATFVIDLNAMILGMPRALFPALGILRFHGGAKTVGLLYAAPGAGALLGAALTGWVAGVRRQGRAVLVSVAVWGFAIAAFGLVRWLAAGLVLLGIAGGADVISAVFRGTILQNEAPDALRGRVSSIHTAVVTGGPRLGDVESGAVASAIGAPASVVSGGLGCVVGVALVRWLMPSLSAYQAHGHEASGEEARPSSGGDEQ